MQAVLSDLDGVLRDWSGQDTAGVEARFGIPPGAITRTAFDPDLLVPAITGVVTDEVWRARIVDRLCARYPDADAQGAIAAWSEPAGAIDDAVLALLQTVRRQVPVVLVTNATSRLDRDLARLGVTDAFDSIVNSSAVGAAKPDRAIFNHALAQVGADAGETLYIDDTASYHGPAAELGLICHHYRGIAELRQTLVSHGLA